MKKIFKILFIYVFAAALFSACDEIEVGFDKLTDKPDLNNTLYYLQFVNASKTLETGVTEAGALIEIETPVAVALMGTPQSQPITVNLVVDPSSTITSAMYTLSANSITIAAGKTSGSVTVKTKAANMTPGETKKLVLTMNVGEHNSPNANGTKLAYNLKRMLFCPLVNGLADLVGSWTGTDGTYPSVITTVVDGTKLKVSGMSKGLMEDWWAEKIIAGGSFLMTVKGNGIVDIPRQYIYSTDYPDDYEIKGSGKWENCGAKPRLIITYDIYYPGDTDGIVKTYGPAYLGGLTFLTADVTLSGKESDVTVNRKFKPIDPSLKPHRE